PGQALTVARQTRGYRTSILDRHPMRFGDPVRARDTRRRVVGEVHRLLAHRREVIEDTLDAREALNHVSGEAHGPVLCQPRLTKCRASSGPSRAPTRAST